MKRYYNHTDEDFIHLDVKFSYTVTMWGHSKEMKAEDYTQVIEVALGRRTAFVSEAAYKATVKILSLIEELGTMLLENGVGSLLGVHDTEFKMVKQAVEQNLAPWDRTASLRAKRTIEQM
ncbi:MAG: hypothetical protein F4Z16_06660 [Rhodothermaceae bacterium]|nr:hypothetical protein [Rhodothermaceae bacterium]MYD66834.1 hypothetical protein [Rhodothermaceae bacterium]MYI78168.1 hypothetical protein [Gammaproteobacteria bacterium]